MRWNWQASRQYPIAANIDYTINTMGEKALIYMKIERIIGS